MYNWVIRVKIHTSVMSKISSTVVIGLLAWGRKESCSKLNVLFTKYPNCILLNHHCSCYVMSHRVVGVFASSEVNSFRPYPYVDWVDFLFLILQCLWFLILCYFVFKEVRGNNYSHFLFTETHSLKMCTNNDIILLRHPPRGVFKCPYHHTNRVLKSWLTTVGCWKTVIWSVIFHQKLTDLSLPKIVR